MGQNLSSDTLWLYPAQSSKVQESLIIAIVTDQSRAAPSAEQKEGKGSRRE